MDALRSRVAKKTTQFIKKAQALPPGVPPPQAAPAPGAIPGAPAPAMPKPPMMPAAPKPVGAPAMPGVPPVKTKEEIEQGVERDIRKQKEQEKKLEDLSTKVNTIGDQMEGLSKSVNNLVNVLQKDKGEPTTFEQKMEDVKKKDDGDASSLEFGLGKSDESLVRAKEEQKMSATDKLREDRKQRLNAEELQYHTKNPPNKKYKQVVPAPQITKLKDEPGDWNKQYERILKASDMAMDLNAAGTEWAVVNKNTDQIFYKLHPTAETADKFPTKEFAELIIKDVKEMGLEAAMEKYSAEPFSSDIFKRKDHGESEKPAGFEKKPFSSDILKPKKDMGPVGKPAAPKKEMPVGMPGKKALPGGLGEKKEMPIGLGEKKSSSPVPSVKKPSGFKSSGGGDWIGKAGEATEEKPVEEVVAQPEAIAQPTDQPAKVDEPETKIEEHASQEDFKRQFVRAFRLALSAQQKNLADNPLKAAWYETLNGLGVSDHEAKDIIETTFARSSAEHFECTLIKTAEYLGLSTEAFVEMESQIGTLNTLSPITATEQKDEEQSVRAATLRARALRASLPLTTASVDEDISSQIGNALPRPKLFGISQFPNPTQLRR